MLRRLGHPAAFATLTAVVVAPPLIVAASLPTRSLGVVAAVPGAFMGSTRKTSYVFDHVVIFEADDGALVAHNMNELYLTDPQLEADILDGTVAPCADLHSFPGSGGTGLLTRSLGWSHERFIIDVNQHGPCAASKDEIAAFLRALPAETAPEYFPDLTGITFNAPSNHQRHINALGLVGDAVYATASALWLIALTQLPSETKRAARLRRNRCPKCNYAREGLAADALCPECGAAVTP